MLALAEASLPTVPTPEDLAATEDVQITPAIQELAQSLNREPVKIYNWVRNYIEYLPTYGSIQGSDLTLQTQRGNAFDTASLLIALLRASNVPARYVYGTVQLPIDQVMNWVGGVTSPEAALDLLGQGGIPSVAVTFGGKITSVRLEHVWVEAYVDYVPSRGARNKQGDTWVPLDAAFKQYQYTSGMDISTAVPFDAQSFITQIQQGATINETEGWVQNIDQAKIQQALTDYQNQVKTYIDSQNANATVGDVLGTQKIVLQEPSILMGTLPYQTLAVGARLQVLPDELRWKYRTEFSDAWGNPLATLQKSTPALAGKKITFSFLPGSQADLDLINSYLPEPHPDGTPIQPSELPESLPGYLIHLKAEIRVDGELIQQSSAAPTMGAELGQSAALYNPATGQWEEGSPNRPIAGEYHAFALDLQGVGASQLAALKTKLEQTKAKLEQFQQNPNDATPIQNLTKEDLSGDLLYAGILGYFASVDGADNLAARSSKTIVHYRMPSYGGFSATAQPLYWFGIARSVRFPGVTMDVDYLHTQAEAKDADPKKRIAYLRQVGSAGSAFEHAVPEKLFIDPATCNAPGTTTPDPNKPACPQGVSAVKAIALAAQQGQKVYTLNQANQSLHASLLSQISIEAEARQEIQYALAAGLEVTVHQSPITVSGWTGSGYILIDKDTGAGAYKISGGANGAFLAFLGALLIVFGLYLSPLFAAAGLVALVPFYLLSIGASVFIAGILTFFSEMGSEFLLNVTMLRAIAAYLAHLAIYEAISFRVLIVSLLFFAVSVLLPYLKDLLSSSGLELIRPTRKQSFA